MLLLTRLSTKRMGFHGKQNSEKQRRDLLPVHVHSFNVKVRMAVVVGFLRARKSYRIIGVGSIKATPNYSFLMLIKCVFTAIFSNENLLSWLKNFPCFTRKITNLERECKASLLIKNRSIEMKDPQANYDHTALFRLAWRLFRRSVAMASFEVVAKLLEPLNNLIKT